MVVSQGDRICLENPPQRRKAAKITQRKANSPSKRPRSSSRLFSFAFPLLLCSFAPSRLCAFAVSILFSNAFALGCVCACASTYRRRATIPRSSIDASYLNHDDQGMVARPRYVLAQAQTRPRAIAFENRTPTAKARRSKGNAKESRMLEDQGSFDGEIRISLRNLCRFAPCGGFSR